MWPPYQWVGATGAAVAGHRNAEAGALCLARKGPVVRGTGEVLPPGKGHVTPGAPLRLCLPGPRALLTPGRF
jgi:hypothetical protein